MATTYLRSSAGVLKTADGVLGIDWTTWPANVVAQAPNLTYHGTFGAVTVAKSTIPQYYVFVDRGGGVGPYCTLRLALTADGHLCWSLSMTEQVSGWVGFQSIKATKTLTPPNAIPYGAYTFQSESHGSNGAGGYAGPFLITRTDDTGSIVTVTSSNPLPRTMNGVPYSQTLTASGGTAPYTWTIDAGTLPAGITLSANGTLSGTPTADGDFNITFRAFDANGYTGSKAFTRAPIPRPS